MFRTVYFYNRRYIIYIVYCFMYNKLNNKKRIRLYRKLQGVCMGDKNGKIQLTVYVHPQGDAERRAYLSTESNVENILGVHEFKGHGLLGIGSSQHWKILQMQRRHPSWKQTTPALRELYEYLEKNIPSEYYKH